MKHLLATSILAITLAACSGSDDVQDDDLIPEQQEAEVAAKALPGTDFAELELGAKIVGPQGPEVKARLTNETGAFADITSYVACPAGMDVCDPATAPDGTIYTYVHIVYPGEDNDPTTGSGDGADASDVETADAFRMTGPSHGFTGVAGFSAAEAIAAMDEQTLIVISCHEQGLSWTLETGDGGDQWERGEPITFFWQSTVPPAGPAERYEIFANHTAASGPGPYPGADSSANNACANTVPSTSTSS